MSHIDEGELTAYADGAWAPGEPDARRIEAHLAECANCRNRLAQASELSARAAELLAFAAPRNVVAPAFDTLQLQAVQPKPRPRIPLAWAASIILALGLGWFGRDMLLPPPPTTMAVQERAASSQGSAPAQPLSAPAATTSSEAASTPEPEQPMRTASREATSSEAAATGEAASAPAVALAPPSPAAPPPMAEAGRASGFAAREEDALAQKVAADEAVSYMTVAEAERQGMQLRMIPELEVLRVAVIAGDVRVEQKLPDGRIVTIARDQTADTEARSANMRDMRVMKAQAANIANSVRIQRGDTTLVIFGPVPVDSLRSLGAKIR